MRVVTGLKYAFVLWLSGVLNAIKLNVVEMVPIDGQIFFAKRRRWFAASMITCGNLYLRCQRTATRVLSNQEWCRWELRVYHFVYAENLSVDAYKRILIPRRSGESLAAYLATRNRSVADKLSAFRIAVNSLRKLHQVVLPWPDGNQRSLSHGDATAHNVIVDESQTTGAWIDFDFMHDGLQEENWRRADDLRALVYSTAVSLPSEGVPDLVRALHETYNSPAVMETLVAMVARWRDHPVSFHLAQAPLQFQQRMLLDHSLISLWKSGHQNS